MFKTGSTELQTILAKDYGLNDPVKLYHNLMKPDLILFISYSFCLVTIKVPKLLRVQNGILLK